MVKPGSGNHVLIVSSGMGSGIPAGFTQIGGLRLRSAQLQGARLKHPDMTVCISSAGAAPLNPVIAASYRGLHVLAYRGACVIQMPDEAHSCSETVVQTPDNVDCAPIFCPCEISVDVDANAT